MRPNAEFRQGRQISTVRVLLLEDDTTFAELVRANLMRATWGNVVLEHVSTLAAALARLDAGGIDLVISDLNLPDSKGLETIESLARSTDRLILVLTGEREDEYRDAI